MTIVNNDHKRIAILGPTNTGKTYLAFERLISYKSGIFGFPLRLLARENYDKAVLRLGSERVALVTGEEKIIPKDADYYFCTVESMPTELSLECVAIDEIQLSSDYERGYIFTDRILNFRGSLETIFLGSLTIENILKKIYPKIIIDKRDRFSKLSFDKKQNINKLKPRSAMIAFNINKIYELAENLRQLKGGAAVVLGSLSPRTRNAQVEVYENKKVDYLVATDAIGMGLNLNINHVSFSSFQKFDGKYIRNLHPAEIGQIAGRAGRFQNNGTFGYTKDAGHIDPLIIQSVEENNFNNIEKIYWRNSNIEFTSVKTVLDSLKEFPVQNFFIHKKNAEDETNFRFLSSDSEVVKYLTNETAVKILWDICRIPDFQKNMNDNYYDLLKNIFLSLIKNDLKIPENWFHNKVDKLDNYAGGIDELTYKIANIRTWTYISNQSVWLKNNEYWKEKTRNIEDNLSDHLHQSLTNRFIDFSASYFFRNQNLNETPKIEIDNNKSIILNGQSYGYINGFNLKLFNKSESNSLFLLNHVKKSIKSMIEEKVNNFINAPDDSINLGNIQKLKLSNSVNIYWGEEIIGCLTKGNNIFSPKAELINTDNINSDNKKIIIAKLQKWIDTKILTILKPIKEDLENIKSHEVRSIAYNLFNYLGTMPIDKNEFDLKKISSENKSLLSKMGIRIGAKYFFIPNFLKKNSMELNAVLWKIFNNSNENELYPLPNDGRVSFSSEILMPENYWAAIGYICIEKFAVRVDVFERIFFLARQKYKSGPFLDSSDLMNPVGCNSLQLSNILKYCGFDNININEDKKIFFLKQKKQKKSEKILIKTKKKAPIKKKSKNRKEQSTKKEIKLDPNSPFAVLQKLL